MSSRERIIERALQTNPKARNSNMHHIVETWEIQGMGFSESQKEFLLEKAIPPETITRYRRKLQQHGKYPPHDKVKKYREQKFRNIRESAPRTDDPTQLGLM